MFNRKAPVTVFIVACLISLSSVQAWTQDTNTSYEIGMVYYVGEGGSKPLAKEAAPQGGRRNYSGKVSGAHATFRLLADQPQVFQVCGVDPSRFKLFRFKSERNARTVIIAKNNVWIGGTKTVLSESEIPVAIKAAQGNCFTLVPKEALGGGEFGFSPAESNDAFMFGIGDIKSTK